MRRAVFLSLTLLLAACTSGGSDDAASSTTSSSSSADSTDSTDSAATTSMSASPKAGVQRDCLTVSLDYVPLKTALTGSDADLTSGLQFIEAADLDAARQTQQGKQAEVAPAELNFKVATAHALAGQTPDRSGLQAAYSAAANACQPFGAAF